MKNMDGFLEELNALGKEIRGSIGQDDFKHLKKIEWLGRFFSALGYMTAWIIPNPFSAFFMSWGIVTRWCIMHHVIHAGYDAVPGIPTRYTSKGFARGYRRYLDWFDWMTPDAWRYEHNVLHHYNTGQVADPDLVEVNMDSLRKSKLPMIVRYIVVAATSVTWKFTYYVPKTVAMYSKKMGVSENRMVWLSCYLPYVGLRFVLIPCLFLPLGLQAAFFVLINSLLAELITNFHSYLIVGPNHAGSDVMRFSAPPRDKKEYYFQQIAGSVNYNCGNDTLDLLQLWLNYQIEHHIWPDIPMLKYQQYQPRVKALCLKYGLPYVQESVWLRFGKLTEIMVGKESMIQA